MQFRGELRDGTREAVRADIAQTSRRILGEQMQWRLVELAKMQGSNACANSSGRHAAGQPNKC